MAIRDILLTLTSYPDPTPVSVIDRAVSFASALNAHIEPMDIRAFANGSLGARRKAFYHSHRSPFCFRIDGEGYGRLRDQPVTLAAKQWGRRGRADAKRDPGIVRRSRKFRSFAASAACRNRFRSDQGEARS
jgi:hypothetical protein